MARKNLKKSGTKKKSQRAIQQEEEKKAEELRQKEELEKRKQSQKRLMTMTKETMLGIYSIAAAVISWLVDYMGIIALISVILSIFGIRANRKSKRSYLIMSIIALILGGIRLITELYGIMHGIQAVIH